MRVSAEKGVAIAASYGKVGLVCLAGTDLLDWKLSVAASKSVDDAFKQAMKWLQYYQPDVVVVEAIEHSRKGENTGAIIHAIMAASRDLDISPVEITPVKRFKNKYVAAAAVAEAYPDLKPRLPKERPYHEREPRNIIYFEAMALWLEYVKVRLDEDANDQPSLFA